MNAVAVKSQEFQISEVQSMARAIAGSGLFGVKTPDQAFALMLIAQAEGRHPATVAQEYDIIQGRPALKSQAALARFQSAGGRIQWVERSDVRCEARFAHEQGGELSIAWDMPRAVAAGLTGKDNWKKFPCQMLSARVVAEGVRACFPACLNGFYLAEEVADFDSPKPQKTAKPVEMPHVEMADPAERDALLADLKVIGATKAQILDAMGVKSLKSWDEMTREQFETLSIMLRAHLEQSADMEQNAGDADAN
jgi:hypothetical protein